jgi:hypothetical protein
VVSVLSKSFVTPHPQSGEVMCPRMVVGLVGREES